jgi:hypothetical protein
MTVGQMLKILNNLDYSSHIYDVIAVDKNGETFEVMLGKKVEDNIGQYNMGVLADDEDSPGRFLPIFVRN